MGGWNGCGWEGWERLVNHHWRSFLVSHGGGGVHGRKGLSPNMVSIALRLIG